MIDVSSNNHDGGKAIDWTEVEKSGIRYVMIKATEGVDYINPWLEKDAHGARTAGLDIGYYHFAHPGKSSPQEQAAKFQQAIANLPRMIGLSLDLEITEGLGQPELDVWA